MYKAVLLDVDNTLLDFNLSAKETIKICFSVLGVPFTEEAFGVFLRVNDGLWRRIEKKEITRETLHAVRWKMIFSELKINADGGEMERLFLENLANVAVPVFGATEIVCYLSKKYKLYTASNAPYLQQVKRLTDSGLMPYITGILNFEKQGINKPEKRFFDECLKTLSPINKEDIVFIGDSLTADMAGGRLAGFTTVWFDRDGKTAELPKDCDYRVTRLSDIKWIL